MPSGEAPLEAIDEGARRGFEAAWKEGDAPELASHLPAQTDPRYAATLEELCHIDLELRWRHGAGSARLVEGYLHDFPALHATARLRRLLATEYLVRHQHGDAPSVLDYEARFPDLAAAAPPLRETLEGEAASLLRLAAGARLGRYELESEHARGGFGLVWRARDPTLRREVALKQISERAARSPEARRRFLAEARIAARLEHPGVVPVYDLVQDGPRAAYAMKLIRGRTLHAEIQRVHTDRARWPTPTPAA